MLSPRSDSRTFITPERPTATSGHSHLLPHTRDPPTACLDWSLGGRGGSRAHFSPPSVLYGRWAAWAWAAGHLGPILTRAERARTSGSRCLEGALPFSRYRVPLTLLSAPREPAGHVEARGAGPEATFLGRVQLLPEAAALRGHERAGALLLLGPEQAGLRAGLRAEPRGPPAQRLSVCPGTKLY